MSDITITAASVVKGAGATLESGYAGETITAGMAIYKASATGLWMKADSNSATAEAKKPRGIALCGSSLNQPVVVQTGGDITIGATVVAGTIYCLSATAGGICPQADLTTGDDVAVVGVAKSATVLGLSLYAPGVTL
jgi:hypothetical protein